jgi:uroporphyrinogen-III synthase
LNDSLFGARVAILEARRESELASLVRRHGGVPVSVPALAEVERECRLEVLRGVDVAKRDGALVVLATGVGLDRWLRMASDLGRGVELRAALGRCTVVCRGPKPIAVLKREGLEAHLRAPSPHTTTELLATLATVDVRDRDAVYVHDGGGSDVVPAALTDRGARVVTVQPYVWAPPSDPEPLDDLVRALVAGEIDALAVTTQVQARHLFAAAFALGQEQALCDALRDRVIVAAVGPTCAKTLTELGAPPHVVPAQPKMGPLVLALAAYRTARPQA